MNSCLYECRVMHHRLEPLRNAFHYNYFLFYLDLDELDTLVRRNPLMSRDRWNAYSFRDTDHMHQYGSAKASVLEFIRSHGVTQEPGRIMLLANLRTFGYTFNPVCFYFCFTQAGEPLCVVVEIHNTFGEMKSYFINAANPFSGEFRNQEKKYFYVSPFVDMDTTFDFRLAIPSERIHIQIDDIRNGQKFFISTLTGRRRVLTTGRLLWYSVKFPLVTVKVIALIHWQALKLWLRRLPYYRKHEHSHLQKEIYHRKGA